MTNPFTSKAKSKRDDNPFVKKSKPKQKGSALAKVKARRAANNGLQPGEPITIGVAIPEPDVSNPWARKKQASRERTASESDKQDFTEDGVRACHVREHDGFWTVDVVNGNITHRFDNRNGSWFVEVGDGRFKEIPSYAVLAHSRWLKEINRQGRWRGYWLRDEVPTEEKKEGRKKREKKSKDKEPKQDKKSRRKKRK